ncbi:hypothetical protein M3Y97_00030700 [Aphelenchoides bicaudatus]|nr:hypothetical protein M3Y97_00030700 [Aphelenchoides bicaudatus]
MSGSKSADRLIAKNERIDCKQPKILISKSKSTLHKISPLFLRDPIKVGMKCKFSSLVTGEILLCRKH